MGRCRKGLDFHAFLTNEQAQHSWTKERSYLRARTSTMGITWSSLSLSSSSLSWWCPSWTSLSLLSLALLAFTDVFWVLRVNLLKLQARFISPKIRMGDESVVYGFCAPTDIDYYMHMNNSRYAREMDFGRFDFYFRTGLGRHLHTHYRHCFVVQHSALIRYRRSIDFLMPFRLHTRLVWFDHRSLYFEQRFVSLHDDFVRCIAYCRNTIVHCKDVNHMMKEMGFVKPHCPDHLRSLIEAEDRSSKHLKDELLAKGQQDQHGRHQHHQQHGGHQQKHGGHQQQHGGHQQQHGGHQQQQHGQAPSLENGHGVGKHVEGDLHGSGHQVQEAHHQHVE